MMMMQDPSSRAKRTATGVPSEPTSGWRDGKDAKTRAGAPRSVRIEASGVILELVVDPLLVHEKVTAGERSDLLTLQWRLRGSGMLAQVVVLVSEEDLVAFSGAIDRLIAFKASEAVLEGRETPSSVMQLQAAADGSAATLTMLASHAQLPGRFVLERLPLDPAALTSIRNWALG